MRLPDGQTGGYESQPGLAEDLFVEGGHELFGPTELEGRASPCYSQTAAYVAARDQQSMASNPSAEAAHGEEDQHLNNISTEKISPDSLAETGPINLTLRVVGTPPTSAHQSSIEEESIEGDPSIIDSSLNMHNPSTPGSNNSDTKPLWKTTAHVLNVDRQSDSAPAATEKRTTPSFFETIM